MCGRSRGNVHIDMCYDCSLEVRGQLWGVLSFLWVPGMALRSSNFNVTCFYPLSHLICHLTVGNFRC